MVLIMTVEPGFGGQKLILKTLDKIKEVKKLCIKHNRTIDIEADGGITLENVKDVAASGANVIVAGSAVFGASDIREAIKQFKNS